ncbi:MAG: alanine/glycine:cation symporter family protein, partial [Christensenellaceae bacterium]
MELLALLETVISRLNHELWGIPMVLLLFITHLYMTCRTGFIQRKVLTAIRLSLTPEPGGEGDISPFASLATALASTIGTGNIVGVGTAIALGGPGAVFWCWLAGIFGMATKYAEALIAVRFRVKSADGRMMGGAMYALERGLHRRGLALLFALFGALASLGIGCGVQVNALSQAVTRLFPSIEPWSVGLAASVTAALAILGGVKGLGRVCERLVPFMAIFFVMGCTVILWQCRDVLPAACRAIVTLAFQPGAVAGGLAGSGIIAAARYGIARGLFSNESGLGSAPSVAAAAQCRNPVR